MPLGARMLTEAGATWGVTAAAEQDKAAALRAAGATVHVMSPGSGGVDLTQVLQCLAQQGCNDVLVEAGPTLAGQFFQQRLVDELVLYLAPRLLGPQARAMLQLPLLQQLSAAPGLQLQCNEQIGQDVKLVFKC